MVGGGQLARMTHQAGFALGVDFRLLSEGPDSAAAQVVRDPTVGDYRDLATVRDFARGLDVLTFDHEHVPTEHLRALESAGVAVRPGPEALEHAQDKGLMRERLVRLGLPCPRHRIVADTKEVESFADDVGWPVVLKTTRGGYDGKGVWVLDGADELAELEGAGREPFLAGVPVLAEERVDFARELAALVVRSPSGQAVAYPVVESVQRDGICHEVLAPAPNLSGDSAARAQRIGLDIAGQLGVVGVLAVELFETRDGGLAVNELAMRPHNTGHWSIDGAVTSQFENHLRAVLDLPLGSPEPRAPWTVMVNVLGGPAQDLPNSDLPNSDLHWGFLHTMARDPGMRVHLYGKQVKPGRKVGHVNVYGDDLEDVRARARHAAAYLAGEIDE